MYCIWNENVNDGTNGMHNFQFSNIIKYSYRLWRYLKRRKNNCTHLRLNIPLNVMDPRPLNMVLFLNKAYWEMVLLNWLTRPPLQTMKTPNRPVYICSETKWEINQTRKLKIGNTDREGGLCKWKLFPDNSMTIVSWHIILHRIGYFPLHPTWHIEPTRHISNLVWLI